MGTVQKSLRIHADIAKAIQESAEASGKDFSAVTNEFLAESVKLRRCPGILFADGPSGRRARIAGTGIDVWEVIATFRSVGTNSSRLRKSYHWLSEPQIRAALGYYSAYPDEIDRQIARNEGWTKEGLAERHPALAADDADER
jgi:uncharacterized protein (DUF433 family)